MMKPIYEAQNSVEAHMVLNLLEQAGLSATIEGEYLQGGIGELQAIGLVRVMIADEDYAEAKQIIEEWDARQPAKAKEEALPAPKKRSFAGSGLIGFALGITAMLIYYNTPVTEDGIDYNGDGVLDEKWTYANYRITKAEADRNFDGKIDYIYYYDEKGIGEYAKSDDDFNGSFETEVTYRFGNPVYQKSDTTGDGFKDYRAEYKNGILDKTLHLNPASRRVIKVQQYDTFKLVSAEVDTSGDGRMDTLYQYNDIEEISGKFHP